MHINWLHRREILVLSGAAMAGSLIGPTSTDTPILADDPAAKPIGLFMNAGAAAIDPTVTVVKTSGWALDGLGAAVYRVDPAFLPAQHPRAGFRAADGRLFSLAQQALTVEMFGARGDLSFDQTSRAVGGTNDTVAFAAASAWIEGLGGGTLHCRPGGRYLVGEQRFQASDGKQDVRFCWAGQPIIRIAGAQRPVTIEGHGAVLKAAPGYRYGVFDARTGAPKATKTPYAAPAAEIGFPYYGMVEIRDCRGGFTIRDLELDGSAETLVLGGEHGDLGRQINGCGIYTLDNIGPVTVENVSSHHHPWDGWLLRHRGSVAGGGGKATISRFHASNNGRQGLSLTGGSGGTVSNSRFTRSGRGLPLTSAPAAGLDIEPEGGATVRDWSFQDCLFGGGAGVALLAAVNDSADLRFSRCEIHGAYEIAAWAGRPGIVFEGCLFTGMVTAVHPATRFSHCRFSDAPRLSPFGIVHLATDQILLNLANAAGVVVDTCSIARRSAGIALYCDQRDASFRTCTIQAAGHGTNVIWGRWSGHSSISINVKAVAGAYNASFTQVARGSTLSINGNAL